MNFRELIKELLACLILGVSFSFMVFSILMLDPIREKFPHVILSKASQEKIEKTEAQLNKVLTRFLRLEHLEQAQEHQAVQDINDLFLSQEEKKQQAIMETR